MPSSGARDWRLAHFSLEEMRKKQLEATLMTYNTVLTKTDKYWRRNLEGYVCEKKTVMEKLELLVKGEERRIRLHREKKLEMFEKIPSSWRDLVPHI